MKEPLHEDVLRQKVGDARKASSADQMVADADQSASDADQISSDTDQAASDRDQTAADRDQQASDLDQATADKDRAANRDLSTADARAYESSREKREDASLERLGNRIPRHATARERHQAATDRDRMAEIRDEGGRGRDANAADLELPSTEREVQLLHELGEVRAQAAAARERAAVDRARAASDRAKAAHERGRLEAELQAAHLDELTGAYPPEMGRLTLTHEIERVRRSGGGLVVALVDVDELKTVNDRDSHAAGDLVLQSVVRAIRARLGSFDPIIRYGGDAFVCGMGSTDIAEAQRRFDLIGIAVEADAGVGISVGLAELEPGDTADGLTQRADEAMLAVRAARRAAL
ncbi:MAG TPA: diguanylate cyclase [Candidatus Limnocylindria bacterium]|nr:diguanylate cyclase [Candidatus Limnocylindria bacterium]